MQKSPDPFFAWAMLVLAILVVSVFAPGLTHEFDDLDTPKQLLNNPHVHGLTADHIKAILRGPVATSSYYPVRSLSYALDYEIWGLRPFGFKLTNLLIHLANVWLVLAMILRLLSHSAGPNVAPSRRRDVLAAGAAAALFAVHPLVVEPVAWIPGREELLMTFWILVCFHCHVTARSRTTQTSDQRSAWGWRAAATAAGLLACLSNAVAAVVALLITAWDALTLSPPRWRRIGQGTAVLWLIGAVVVSAKFVGIDQDERVRQRGFEPARQIPDVAGELGADGPVSTAEPHSPTSEKTQLVAGVLGHNLRSLAWPTQLAVSYEGVAGDGFAELHVVIGLLAAVVLCLGIWLLRRYPMPLFGLLWTAIALAPTSQIVPHHIHRADRFLYLPLVGLVAMLGYGLRALSRRVASTECSEGALRLRWSALTVGAGLAYLMVLLWLATLSICQLGTWENPVRIWENSVRIGPRNFFAQRALAHSLAKAGDFERAFAHYQAALQLRVYDLETLQAYAGYLATCPDSRQRDYELAIRLATWARELADADDAGIARTLAVAYSNYAVELGNRGDFARAVEHYQNAMRANPRDASPVFNLALLRAVCPDPAIRQPEEAYRLAKQACQMKPDATANELMILATVAAEADHSDEAVAAVERAIAAAEGAGQAEFAQMLQQQLEMARQSVESMAQPARP